MKKMLLLVVVLSMAAATYGSLLDEAKCWWKFDQGGADGALAQAAEIHDVRDAGKGVPTRMCGPNGGPLWRRTAVRLPYRQKDMECTALHVQAVMNDSNQVRPTMVDFSDGHVDGDEVTFFARICPGAPLYTTGTTEYFIYNNNFRWGNGKPDSYGQLFGIALNGAKYSPRFFVGQESDKLDAITMEPGKWYDLAFSVSLATNIVTTATENDTTNVVQRVLCVVAGEEGLFYQTVEKTFWRTSPFAGATGRIGGQLYADRWITVGNNTVEAKDFHGLIHEIALWDRGLTLAELLDVFGRPEAPEGDDVYSDVYRWWKFDRDLDGDGKVSANELRDVRTWGTAAAPAAGNPTVDYATDGGPLAWRNTSVFKPARGETAASDCAVFEPLYRTNENGEFQVYPPRIRFNNSSVAGDATFMARFCITKECDYMEGTKFCYIFQSGFSYGTTYLNMGGYMLGFLSVGASTTSFYPYVYAGKSSVQFSQFRLTTNTWYDIAYTISPQADGTDHVTVTLADAACGIRTGQGTMATSQAYMTSKVLMLGGENDIRGWTTYLNNAGGVANGNCVKNFTGALSQIAIWRRALTKDEIAAAFGYPRAVFGVGTADGTAGEFATAAEGFYDWTVSDTWHDMAGTLDSTHRTLTLRFTPPPNWSGMDQGFHLVAGDVAGATAQVALSVNGAGFGAKAVATGDDVWWVVKGGAIRAGENVATLTLGGTGSLAIDKVEMLGSWALVHGAGNEFSYEGGVQDKDYYVGDRTMAHVTRAVTKDHPSNRLHFYVPPYLTANFPFEFTFHTVNNENACAVFKFNLNGVEVFAAPEGLVNGERTVSFAPGALLPGWNVIEPCYISGADGKWAQCNRYALRMLGPELGTFLLIR